MIEFDLKRLDLLITSQEGRALFPNKDVADQKRGELETHWDNLGIPKNLKCVVDFLSGRDQFVCFDPNPSTSTSTTGGEDTSKSEDCVPDPSVESLVNEDSDSDSDSKPCFSRASEACRILDTAAAPAAAFRACFDEPVPTVAERVKMTDLTGGDYVLSSGKDHLTYEFTRLIVNQHKVNEVRHHHHTSRAPRAL